MKFGQPHLDRSVLKSVVDTFRLGIVDPSMVDEVFYHPLFPDYREAMLAARSETSGNQVIYKAQQERLTFLSTRIKEDTGAHIRDVLAAVSYPDEIQWSRKKGIEVF